MTNQEKKAILLQYRKLMDEIEWQEEEIKRWYALAERTTASIGSIPGGTGGDRLQMTVERISALNEKQRLRIEHNVALYEKLDSAIERIEKPELRMLLRLRYIDALAFAAIAKKMGYSWRQILRMHGDALTAISIENVEF